MELLKQCSRCVLDTKDDPNLTIDELGICNYCHLYDQQHKSRVFSGEEAAQKLKAQIERIKQDGKNNAYDCIIGVSGGVDSTYVAYLAKKYELRPLLVHFDNGWNSELAVQNIENITKKLGFELYTYVINWEEFKDLQLSFLKASVIDIEIVTDHAIFAALYHLARKFNIKHTISGMNVVTEGIMPSHWVHKKNDWLNIQAIHKKYGKIPLKTFPKTSYVTGMLNILFYKVESFDILNYVPYHKEDVKTLITNELGWRDYGGKHFESIFTRFYQAYILPKKFGVDKRKAHLSTLICSGQLTRKEALLELEKPLYDAAQLKIDKEFVLKKFEISEQEFDHILSLPVQNHLDFDSYITKHWKYNEIFFKKIKPITRFFKKLLIKNK